jgi:DNA-binding transcriptional MerR regulator
METLPIGEAARLLGVNTSALRFYEERGLVRPGRKAGTRVYNQEDLRRLAFIRITHRLGLNLTTAKAILDSPSPEWRHEAKAQLDELTELISRAKAAQYFLTHAVNCPAEHPVAECPVMTSNLDRHLAGTSFEEIAAEHLTGEAPPATD